MVQLISEWSYKIKLFIQTKCKKILYSKNRLNENKLQIEEPNMNSNFNLNRNSKFFSNESLVNNNRKSYETLAIENKVLQEKLLQMEEVMSIIKS